MTTRQYARPLSEWIASIGLDPKLFGTHSLRRTKATLIYRRTGNLRAVQLLLGHTKIESTVRYLGIEVDDALSIAEQVRQNRPSNPRQLVGKRRTRVLELKRRYVAGDTVSFPLNSCGFELRLFEPKSPLPGNGISWAETKAPRRPRRFKDAIAETEPARTIPYSPRTRKSPLVRKCVVADAVAIEPVSLSIPWKFTGNLVECCAMAGSRCYNRA
jgi:hypothetical protein